MAPRMVGGRYEVLGEIGRGAMGTVYRARHALTHRMVAVKVLHPELARSRPAAVERLLREAQATAVISHRALPVVLDAGREPGGLVFVVFELLDGRTLAQALKQGDIAPRRLLEIMAEVLDALQAAHGRGVVHRDVKPSNVFLARDSSGQEQVKLLDFGIAKLRGEGVEELTSFGQVLGTVVYMSPEQARGNEVTSASDIWSAGVVLFEGLSGRVPIRDGSPLETLESIAHAPRVSLREHAPQLSAELIEVVDRALSPVPSQRWASAGQMRRALLEAMAVAVQRPEQGVEPTLPSVMVAAARAPSRGPLLGVAIALVMLGAVGTIAVWWMASSTAPVPVVVAPPVPSSPSALPAVPGPAMTPVASGSASPSGAASMAASPSADAVPGAAASPGAVPIVAASPSAAPTGAAGPGAVPAPSASPTVAASPSARPTAVVTPGGAASPSAEPAAGATPSAKPSLAATPSAKPAAVATPSAKPAAVATPSGKAAAVPTPSAKPTAVPAPSAKPTAVPAPSAKPTAVPAPSAKPTATPKPKKPREELDDDVLNEKI